ncbi:XdhC family protein [Kordiimonas sp.]|uniref:XdhC family protein n=1 Tax=Kordiimonas sp. TaxID=1970157 RepID=UPI003A8F678F
MKDIITHLLGSLKADHRATLAVVTKTWGSAPRQVGSMMLVRADGTFEGSVSGGCVEGTVIAEAQALLRDGGHKELSFAVSNQDAFAVGLACGGEINISLFALTDTDTDACKKCLEALTHRASGSLVFSKSPVRATYTHTALQAVRASESDLSLPVLPCLRLDIIGAVHIAQALAPMASECGFEINVIDPRQAFTDNRTFTGAAVINNWPDEHFSTTPPDSMTAVVTLTHDPKLDDAALLPALNSEAFYIGCLGSKKTHSARLSRLEAPGIAEDARTAISGPVGLDIGAKTPAEIAVSILAEIIAAYRSKGTTTRAI